MFNRYQIFAPVTLLVIIVSLIILNFFVVGCTTSTPPPPPSPISTTVAQTSSFSYQVRVRAQNTNEEIRQATVTIEVPGRAPLDDITDVNGLARIFIPVSHINQPGVLLVEAVGYREYRQHIDLIKGALPDVVQLESLAKPTNTPTPTPSTTQTSTPTPTMTTTPTPTPSNTPTPPTDTPSATPTNTPKSSQPTPTPPPPTGRLAIPLVLNGVYKVYIVGVDGTVQGSLDFARQPDYTRDGAQLVVNGDGGPLNKLRVSGPTGQNAQEIGNPSLGGHSHPAWSPNGTQIVFDDSTLGCQGWCIYTRALDDAASEGLIINALGAAPIIDNNPLHPLWTTNNRFIFRGCNTWASAGGGGTCGLWVMQGNGGEPLQLTGDPNHIPTDVHGDIVVYTFKADVYLLDITDGSPEQLTFDPANDGLATISPDGNWVAFLSNRGGRLAVWYRSINQGPPQRMFEIPTDGPKAWGVLSSEAWFDERLSWGS